MAVRFDVLKGGAAVAVAVVLISLTLVSAEARQLRESVKRWRGRAQWPAVNSTVPVISATSLTDSAVQIASGDSASTSVVLLFTTECQYCRASFATWKTSAARLEAQGVRVHWLSLSSRDSTLRLADSLGLPLDRVAVAPDPRAMRTARLRGVPATFVVDGTGRIHYLHTGVFGTKDADSLWLVARANHATRTAARLRPDGSTGVLTGRAGNPL